MELLFILFCALVPFVFAQDCGLPAVPAHATVQFDVYPIKAKTVATYACDPGFILLGRDSRICSLNGTWSGFPPICVVDVALGKPTKSSSQQGRIGSSVAVNGDAFGINSEDSCHSTQPEIAPWWSVNLLDSYIIHSVRVIIGRPCCADGPVYIEVRVGSDRDVSRNTLCGRYSGIVEEGIVLDVRCYRPLRGIFVSVHQMREVPNVLSLCKVQAFSDQAITTLQCPIAEEKTDTADVFTYSDSCYQFYNSQPDTWDNAQMYCMRKGGSLLWGTSPAFQAFVSWAMAHRYNQFSAQNPNYWMGAMRSPWTNGEWMWVKGNTTVNPIRAFWSSRDPPSDFEGETTCVMFDANSGWLWRETSCNRNLNWVCEFSPRSCGNPGVSANSSVQYSSTDVGSVAVYGCQGGLFLRGEGLRRCQPNGKWSGTPPVCTDDGCGTPPPTENGIVTYNSTSVGSVGQYICDDLYKPVGQTTTTCNAEGSWTVEPPQCIPVDCGPAPGIPHGNAVLIELQTSQGSHLQYKCNPGYNLVGNNLLVCTANEVWEGAFPLCHPDDGSKLEEVLLIFTPAARTRTSTSTTTSITTSTTTSPTTTTTEATTEEPTEETTTTTTTPVPTSRRTRPSTTSTTTTTTTTPTTTESTRTTTTTTPTTTTTTTTPTTTTTTPTTTSTRRTTTTTTTTTEKPTTTTTTTTTTTPSTTTTTTTPSTTTSTTTTEATTTTSPQVLALLPSVFLRRNDSSSLSQEELDAQNNTIAMNGRLRGFGVDARLSSTDSHSLSSQFFPLFPHDADSLTATPSTAPARTTIPNMFLPYLFEGKKPPSNMTSSLTDAERANLEALANQFAIFTAPPSVTASQEPVQRGRFGANSAMMRDHGAGNWENIVQERTKDGSGTTPAVLLFNVAVDRPIDHGGFMDGDLNEDHGNRGRGNESWVPSSTEVLPKPAEAKSMGGWIALGVILGLLLLLLLLILILCLIRRKRRRQTAVQVTSTHITSAAQYDTDKESGAIAFANRYRKAWDNLQIQVDDPSTAAGKDTPISQTTFKSTGPRLREENPVKAASEIVMSPSRAGTVRSMASTGGISEALNESEEILLDQEMALAQQRNANTPEELGSHPQSPTRSALL